MRLKGRVIYIGEGLNANGVGFIVKNISADYCEKTLEYSGETLCKEGQTKCVFYGEPENDPLFKPNDNMEKMWVYANCQVDLI